MNERAVILGMLLFTVVLFAYGKWAAPRVQRYIEDRYQPYERTVEGIKPKQCNWKEDLDGQKIPLRPYGYIVTGDWNFIPRPHFVDLFFSTTMHNTSSQNWNENQLDEVEEGDSLPAYEDDNVRVTWVGMQLDPEGHLQLVANVANKTSYACYISDLCQISMVLASAPRNAEGPIQQYLNPKSTCILDIAAPIDDMPIAPYGHKRCRLTFPMAVDKNCARTVSLYSAPEIGEDVNVHLTQDAVCNYCDVRVDRIPIIQDNHMESTHGVVWPVQPMMHVSNVVSEPLITRQRIRNR